MLRKKLFTLWLSQDAASLIQQLISSFTKKKEPLRPNRKTERKKKLKGRNLITQTNFRRSG
jgi:hypothetical protein